MSEASLRESIAGYDRDKLNELYARTLEDWAHDDTEVKNLVGDLVETENDYAFVGVIEIVESLVDLIKQLKKDE